VVRVDVFQREDGGAGPDDVVDGSLRGAGGGFGERNVRRGAGSTTGPVGGVGPGGIYMVGGVRAGPNDGLSRRGDRPRQQNDCSEQTHSREPAITWGVRASDHNMI